MSIRNSLRGIFAVLILTALMTGAAWAEPETAVMTELWRVGGEDDEIFFGSVASIRTDADGNILMLDGQLSEVQVYSSEGEFLRTVFREGDGPGEIRQPNDMFVTSDGTVCALQGFPGKIVKVTSDGLPAGEASFSIDGGNQGQFAVLNRGFDLPEGILLVGIRMAFSGTITSQTYFLAVCDDEGAQQTALVEKDNNIDYTNFTMTESGLDFVWSRIAVSNDGTIFVAPSRDNYDIEVFDQTGAPVRTISREYSQTTRDSGEKKAAHQILEAIAAYYPRPPQAYATEDKAPAIAGMWTTNDGRLWVQTGNAHKSTPEGCWVVLDVFTPDGSFEKQIALPGDYQARQDALFVQPDGLVIVVVGALDAFLNQQAVSSDEDGEESTSQPLEVICYRMGQ